MSGVLSQHEIYGLIEQEPPLVTDYVDLKEQVHEGSDPERRIPAACTPEDVL